MVKRLLDFDAVVVCDDIRVEANGKFILIGVYPHVVKIGEIPGTLGLRAWMSGVFVGDGEVKSELRWRWGTKTILSLSATINAVGGGEFATSTPQMAIKVDESGDLIFQERQNKGAWKTVKSIRIKGPSSNDQEQTA